MHPQARRVNLPSRKNHRTVCRLSFARIQRATDKPQRLFAGIQRPSKRLQRVPDLLHLPVPGCPSGKLHRYPTRFCRTGAFARQQGTIVKSNTNIHLHQQTRKSKSNHSLNALRRRRRQRQRLQQPSPQTTDGDTIGTMGNLRVTMDCLLLYVL